MKKILIINGNPKKNSFSDAIADAYCKMLVKLGADCINITLRDLDFNYNVLDNNTKQIVEPDILKMKEHIVEASHIVFVYPDWWGTYPALLKAFIDRTFVNGFAFEYQKGKALPKKLLIGRSARVFVSMDTPKWYYKFFYGKPGHNSMKKSFLNFIGIKPVKFTIFTPMRYTSDETRAGYLKKVGEIAAKDFKAIN